MKKNDIIWAEQGWTILQDADAEKHVLEISCLTQDNMVVEVRMRHSDGEEVVLKKAIDGEYFLPMAQEEFKKLYLADKFKLKK